MDMQALGDALLKAGAPLLKDLVVNAVGGGIKGKIAGAAIDALADNLGVTAKTEDARVTEITRRIETDPQTAAPAVRYVEEQFVKTMDMGTGSLERYVALLETDANSEGIVSRLWRPLFALVFTLCFVIQIVTFCWLMWTRQLGTLAELGEITTYLTFMNIAGCAVLGIQVWKRTEEKKSGI